MPTEIFLPANVPFSACGKMEPRGELGSSAPGRRLQIFGLRQRGWSSRRPAKVSNPEGERRTSFGKTEISGFLPSAQAQDKSNGFAAAKLRERILGFVHIPRRDSTIQVRNRSGIYSAEEAATGIRELRICDTRRSDQCHEHNDELDHEEY